MKRVNRKIELDLMLPDSNRRNIKNFGHLVNYFFYDHDTNKRIERNLSPITKPFPHNYLDKKLDLNSQLRAFYSIKLDEDTDPAFEEYISCLDYNFLQYINNTSNYVPSDDDPYKKLLYARGRKAGRYKITKYETFRSGKIKVGKQQQKLFKYLLANDMLSTDQVDRINTLKTKGDLYLCLTRNPVDYLFASTNQNFSSCLNLDSTGENCYWMGLGALNLDPNRFMLFLTNGKVQTHILKGMKFKHFTYISRTWALLNSKDKMLIIKSYPSEHIDYLKELSQISNLDVFDDEDAYHQGKFSMKIPRYENGDACSIYCDDIGYAFRHKTNLTEKKSKGNEEKTWYMSDDGCGSGALTEFDYEGTFEQLLNFDMLRDSGYACEYCGNMYSEQDMLWFENTGSICEQCYEENWFSCTRCGDVFDTNTEVCKYDGGGNYCEPCFYTDNIKCEFCGEDESDQDAFNVDGEDYCTTCYEDSFFTCEHCEEASDRNDSYEAEDSMYCLTCYDEIFEECNDCDETIRQEDSENIEGYPYCSYCAEERRTKNEATN